MTGMRIVPDREEFLALAAEYPVVPVVATIEADWWTPIGAFHRLAADAPHAFLLESVEGGERLGRYSFLGRRPYRVLRARGDEVRIEAADGSVLSLISGDPLAAIKDAVRATRGPRRPDLPPFVSGAVGYLGYDAVRWSERLPEDSRPPAVEDDAVLLFLREVLAFDHVRRRLTLAASAIIEEDGGAEGAYAEAVDRLHALVAELHRPWAPPAEAAAPEAGGDADGGMSEREFTAAVGRAKEHIAAGDAFQIVLSRRFTVPTRKSDIALYRSLRAINPSPYLFLLRLGDCSAIGSSPEPLLRVHDGRMTYRPIAGTMPRSGDEAEDARRAEALLADPKERAEHVMLVDLGRNDLGRCAETGSVSVDELMRIERYSHVMHIVSSLSARLRADMDALDALMACFPAGTVSGAPKVRAMEIIQELEPVRRGLYAGAVGYLDGAGNLDTCIALRTMLLRNGTASVQAGAGIVADSDPRREFEETAHKARALLAAARAGERAR